MKEYALLGEHIEGYHVTAELGLSSPCRSFIGERCTPTASSECVVIKLWPTVKDRTHKKTESVLQELAQLQQLSHPHILPILSVGLYRDVLYSLTEYVALGSLDTLLQCKTIRHPLQEEYAFSLLAQIGQALHYAHRQKIVHGRLKPYNVLLKPGDQVVISDFQPQTLLSSEKAGLTVPSDLSMYLAPEQLSGETTPKSDQYALGCLAYEMLTGTKVFMIPSTNMPGKYYKTKSLIPPRHLNPALSPQTEQAILKALSKDPAQRYKDIPAFLAALEPSATAGEKQQEMAAIPVIPIMGTNDVNTGETKSHPREGAEAQQARSARKTFPFLPSRQGSGKSRKQGLIVITLCLLAFVIEARLLGDFVFSHPSPIASVYSSISASVTATHITPTSLPSHRTPTVQPTHASVHITPTSLPSYRTPIVQPTHASAHIIPTRLVEVPLSALFNNKGAGSRAGEANFDGNGYSYPDDQLPSGSSINVNGVPYQFPIIASGINDNIMVYDQTIPLTPGQYRQANFLVTSIWGPVTGTLTVLYTDGSSSTIHLTVPDWIDDSNKASNITDALQTSYRYSSYSKSARISYIYAATVLLDPTRTAKALVLPSQLTGMKSTSQLHVFALTMLP
jgi:serine/threonine protein kinase